MTRNITAQQSHNEGSCTGTCTGTKDYRANLQVQATCRSHLACDSRRAAPRRSRFGEGGLPIPERRVEAWFPRVHAARTHGPAAAAAEPEAIDAPPRPNERRLQCAWYDARIRPARLQTTAGESVEVEHPGAWNAQAGPDFLGAALRLGPARRRVRGDVELHWRPADWLAHGHGEDPRYAGVCAHVTWLSGHLPEGALPEGAVEIAFQPTMDEYEARRFEDLDPTAYPWSAPPPPTPCARALAAWGPDAREALLAAAGEERMRRKAARFHASAVRRGEDQALHEELLAGLGYAGNKSPARQLAERRPWTELRARADGDAETAYALLLDGAGLLPPTEDPAWGAETRAAWRSLWQRAWPHRAALGEALPRAAWKLAPIRPLNHPLRRLRAAAEWVVREAHPAAALRALATGRTPAQALAAWTAWLDVPATGYWARQHSWNGPRVDASAALVGPGRARALILNAVVPLLGASGMPDDAWRALLEALPAEEASLAVREAARALFGADHPNGLLRSGLRRQGVLEILQTHCLASRDPCATCALRTRLEGEEEGIGG
jgi:hypothetical protein